MTGTVLVQWLVLVCVGTWATTSLALRVCKQGEAARLGVQMQVAETATAAPNRQQPL